MLSVLRHAYKSEAILRIFKDKTKYLCDKKSKILFTLHYFKQLCQKVFMQECKEVFNINGSNSQRYFQSFTEQTYRVMDPT